MRRIRIAPSYDAPKYISQKKLAQRGVSSDHIMKTGVAVDLFRPGARQEILPDFLKEGERGKGGGVRALHSTREIDRSSTDDIYPQIDHQTI